VFIDVGAHIGFFSLLGAKRVGKNGLVLAFEPSPKTRSRLFANASMNGGLPLQILPYAVSDTVGKAVFFQHNQNPGQNSLRPLGEETAGKLEVETVTLDGFLPADIADRVTLVKMDIEGAELLALQGMRRLLAKEDSPDVMCEVTDEFLRTLGASESELLSFMTDLGYSAFVVSAATLMPNDHPRGGQYTALFTKRLDSMGRLLAGMKGLG
jgi:FkbM family methyltransferase